MSRGGGEYEGDGEQFQNEWAFWEHRVRRVLSGKPGRKALAELREALLALPEKRLISNALSTAGKAKLPVENRWEAEDRQALLAQGEGVCAVGAFVWHKRVKAGADPVQAMQDLPLNPDYNGNPDQTISLGQRAGLSNTLAWVLMNRNDDTCESLTPEERYESFLEWIDKQLAASTK